MSAASWKASQTTLVSCVLCRDLETNEHICDLGLKAPVNWHERDDDETHSIVVSCRATANTAASTANVASSLRCGEAADVRDRDGQAKAVCNVCEETLQSALEIDCNEYDENDQVSPS